jgi:hypothetical protein
VERLGVKILAVDPGPESSQWLMWDTEKRCVIWSEHNPNTVEVSPATFCFCDLVAIEMIACYGMPVGAEVFETCYYIGQLLTICDANGIDVLRVYRKDVKLELCGTPRAKDGNVRQALIDKLGSRGTKKAPGPTYGISGHAWAALAVAWYAATKVKAWKADPYEMQIAEAIKGGKG